MDTPLSPNSDRMEGRDKSLATGLNGKAGRYERIIKDRSWAHCAAYDQLAQLRGAVFVHHTDSCSSGWPRSRAWWVDETNATSELQQHLLSEEVVWTLYTPSTSRARRPLDSGDWAIRHVEARAGRRNKSTPSRPQNREKSPLAWH